MASVYKKGDVYVIDYYDARGIRHRKTGFREKGLTMELAAKLERDKRLVRSGLMDPREARWAEAEQKPLREHVEEWAADLRGAKRTEGHVKGRRSQVLRLLGLTRASRVSHLDPTIFQAAIGRLHDREGLSLQSCTHYVRSAKQFSKWLRDCGRCRDHRLVPLKGYNAAADPRRCRRELTGAELVALMRAAGSDGVVGCMEGPDRAMLYLLAVSSGLRASELASLTPESFELDGEPPVVIVAAKRSKRRKRDVQPLPRMVAEVLKPWLEGRKRGKPCFGFDPQRGARMIRRDLETARAAWLGEASTEAEREARAKSGMLRYEAEAGIADFHALRHTFVSRLVRSGVNPKVAQRLARHSTAELTLSRYAHADVEDGAAALEHVPPLVPDALGGAPKDSALPLPEPFLTVSNGRGKEVDSLDSDPVESCAKGAFRRVLAPSDATDLCPRRGGRVDEGDGFENR